MSHAEAIEQLHKVSGKRLDPSLVEVFVAEPEESWNQLERSPGQDFTFERALQTCKRVIRTSVLSLRCWARSSVSRTTRRKRPWMISP